MTNERSGVWLHAGSNRRAAGAGLLSGAALEGRRAGAPLSPGSH